MENPVEESVVPAAGEEIRREDTQAMKKYPDGPHQRAGRRRRRGKAAVLVLVLAFLASATSSALTRDLPPQADDELTDVEYDQILRDCKISRFVAEEYGKEYPEHAAEFLDTWKAGWE